MTPLEVKDRLGSIPWMTLEQGQTISHFIQKHAVSDVLELGFCHGVSTCYMAAALAARGGGTITTIDLESSAQLSPTVEELLDRLGLREMVTVYREQRCYSWRLMNFMEGTSLPQFDLCYIDGAHDWKSDGFSFFLVDRMLRPGGWIVLDDLDWTVATHIPPALRDCSKMTIEQQQTPQVRKVFELLIRTHPNYDHFHVEDGWAFARKRIDLINQDRQIATETIVKSIPVPWEMLRRRMQRSQNA